MNKINVKRNDLDEIIEVKELNLIRDVNIHIKLGWKLIDTYKTTSVNQSEVIKYCLGWPKAAVKRDTANNKSRQTNSKAAKSFVYSL